MTPPPRVLPRPGIGFVPGPPRRERPTPPLRVLLGAVLRSERTEQGKTLRVVADAARISMAYLSEVERGRKEASSEILAAICQALGLRLVDLLGRVQWLLLADGIDDLERDPLGADRTVVRLSPLDGTGDPGRSAPTVSGTAFALALAG